MRARLATPLAIVGVTLVTVHCERRTPAPDPNRPPSASVVSSSSAPAPAASSPPPAALGSGDCEKRHWQNPWRPLQTAEKPVQAVACAGPGCVAIQPLLARGEPCPDRCRRVTVTPRVAGNEAVQKLLDAQITEVTGDDCWLTFLDYTVHHDSNGVLDVTFRMSGLGAYPSTQTVHVTIDLATGSRLRAADVFSSRTLPELTRAMNAKVLAAWRRAEKEHAEVYRGREAPRFAREHLDSFIVRPEGITFFFDYGLPHAIELAMPASEFPFSKRDISHFIDEKGPLRFLRDG
jgi:hypothetical protein